MDVTHVWEWEGGREERFLLVLITQQEGDRCNSIRQHCGGEKDMTQLRGVRKVFKKKEKEKKR